MSVARSKAKASLADIFRKRMAWTRWVVRAILGSMAWLDSISADAPEGLAQWARAQPNAAAARAACPRADWLLWLMTSASDSEQTKRWVLHTATLAIDHSPSLRGRAPRVAAVYRWASPEPTRYVPRSVARPLLFAAILATALVALLDITITARIAALASSTGSLWVRSAIGLAIWCSVLVVLQKTFERRAERRVETDVRSMSFAKARVIVVGELARHPEDSRVLKELRDASNAEWFRSTTS